MRIHIIGGSGAGKTWLARRLSWKTGVPRWELDDLFWDNSGAYGQKRPAADRDDRLRALLQQESWIIEGVYHDWVGESFERAGRIILLDPPGWRCGLRVAARFLRRKLGLERGKKESLGSLVRLLCWSHRYRKNELPQIRRALRAYGDKTVVLCSKREVKDYLAGC